MRKNIEKKNTVIATTVGAPAPLVVLPRMTKAEATLALAITMVRPRVRALVEKVKDVADTQRAAQAAIRGSIRLGTAVKELESLVRSNCQNTKNTKYQQTTTITKTARYGTGSVAEQTVLVVAVVGSAGGGRTTSELRICANHLERATYGTIEALEKPREAVRAALEELADWAGFARRGHGKSMKEWDNLRCVASGQYLMASEITGGGVVANVDVEKVVDDTMAAAEIGGRLLSAAKKKIREMVDSTTTLARVSALLANEQGAAWAEETVDLLGLGVKGGRDE